MKTNEPERELKTVLLMGHAKLPEETASQSLYGSIAVALELEASSGTILSASFTLAPAAAGNFLGKILHGKRLPDDLELCVTEIAARYLGPTQGAIIAALRAANDRWESFLDSEN